MHECVHVAPVCRGMRFQFVFSFILVSARYAVAACAFSLLCCCCEHTTHLLQNTLVCWTVTALQVGSGIVLQGNGMMGRLAIPCGRVYVSRQDTTLSVYTCVHINGGSAHGSVSVSIWLVFVQSYNVMSSACVRPFCGVVCIVQAYYYSLVIVCLCIATDILLVSLRRMILIYVASIVWCWARTLPCAVLIPAQRAQNVSSPARGATELAHRKHWLPL